jgi:preprotein translocase subunit SecA
LYKEDQHYVVRNGEIIPVDWRGTGSFQKNVEWEKGLQQFLQMKHGLKVSIENMTSNYISNIGHFNRFDYVFGMTGTLGSFQSKKFLN